MRKTLAILADRCHSWRHRRDSRRARRGDAASALALLSAWLPAHSPPARLARTAITVRAMVITTTTTEPRYYRPAYYVTDMGLTPITAALFRTLLAPSLVTKNPEARFRFFFYSVAKK